MHCNAATWNFITSGKSHARTGIGDPSKQERVVLRRRNTDVRGKNALPRALLVIIIIIIINESIYHAVSKASRTGNR